MSWARRFRVLAVVLAAVMLLAACGGDDGGGGDEGGGGGGDEGGVAVTIAGFAFDPSTIEVTGPTEVTVTNEDSASHTFTLDDGSVDEVIEGGASVTVTVDVPETTGFSCRFHPQMQGTVEVA